MTRTIALDTETCLIAPANLAPSLVCVTWQESGKAPEIEHHSTIEPRLREWVADPDAVLVGHNLAFDVAVLLEHFADLEFRRAVFDAYEADRCTDTMLRAQLLDIAGGVYRGRIGEKGVWIRHDYTLDAVAKRFAGIKLSKDGWRLSYSNFLNTPLAGWIDRAKEVQEDAKRRKEELERLPHAGKSAQEKALKKEIDGLCDMIASDPSQCLTYPLEDASATLAVYQAQERHAGYLKDQYRQARGHLALYLSSVWGLRTDGVAVEKLRAEVTEYFDKLQKELIEDGLVKKDGVRDTKAAKALMIEVCRKEGRFIRRTDGHKEAGKCKDREGNVLEDGHEDCFEHVCLDSDACKASEDPRLLRYEEYSEAKKVLSNDVEMLLKGTTYPLHPRYGIAETGRSTCCIARGEPIQMPCDRRKYPRGKPIEEVREGDRVYSYSQDGTLHLQRVLWAGCNGRKPLVKVLWRGQGRHHYGEVRLTADHRVMTLDGKWVEAGQLRPGMRLTALSCRAKNEYQYLYARGGVDHREHVFAHTAVHGPAAVVHHVDHDGFNNSLSNLEGLSSSSEHAKRHATEASPETIAKRTANIVRADVQAKARAAVVKGAAHHNWKDISRSTLLRWAAMCKGKIRKIMDRTGSDYDVLQRKYELAGIDLMKLRQRYNGRGEYITRQMVREAAQLTGNARHKALHVSHGRFRRLLDVYGLSGNHEVIAVIEDGEDLVYDLEVEHTHSFVAGEICVHNSKPNIQNLRRFPGIRECIIPRPGKVFAQADFPQLELYTLAQCCVTWLGESKLADALNAGLDPHLAVAAQILGIEYAEAERRYELGDEDVDNARQIGKVCNFGFPGGLGPDKLVLFAKKTYGVVLTRERAVELKAKWLETWPEMQTYFVRINSLVQGGFGDVESLFTERFRGGATYCAACNSGFQGLGADCAKNSAWKIARAGYVEESSPLFNGRVVAFVHDEFIVEVDDNDLAHDAAYELARLMVEGANVFLPDVPIPMAKMKPLLMRRWSKKAKPCKNNKGRLVPWSSN